MQELDDSALLREYVAHDSHTAFAALVARHVNKVYSVALRHTRNAAQAEEITQTVFVILAQKARALGQKVILSGWLYQTARLTAVTFLRAEIRRDRREQEAHMQTELNGTEPDVWPQIAPLLDEAMAGLSETDRHAVVLRFFDGKSLKDVGAVLGASEDATKMRVNRALEKLRKFFSQRGVKLTAMAIAGAVSANSVQAAPVGLAARIAVAALSGTVVTTGTIIATTTTIAMTTFQKIAVTAALTATIGAGIYQAKQVHDARADAQTLREQQAPLTEQIRQLQTERDNAATRLADLLAENSQLKSNPREAELLKLRGEVTRLQTADRQKQSDPLEAAASERIAKVNQLKQRLEQMPNERIPELQYLTTQDWLRGATYAGALRTDDELDRALSQLRRDAKRTFAYSMGEALANYLAGHNGSLPDNLSQLASCFNPPIDETMLQRYQLSQTGKLSDISNNEPLITEKAPVDDQYDTLFKISATGFSYEGTGKSWVNGSGKGEFGTNITAKIKPFERQN